MTPTISSLIENLQQAQKEFGDVPVVLHHHEMMPLKAVSALESEGMVVEMSDGKISTAPIKQVVVVLQSALGFDILSMQQAETEAQAAIAKVKVGAKG